MHKKILITIMSFIILLSSSVCYAAETTNTVTTNSQYKIIIEDDANLLIQSEEDRLQIEMQKLTEYGNIAFKSINSNSSTTERYASNYYHNKFGNQSGTVFLIDMAKRNIYIFSDGSNYKIINSDKAEVITDNIYTYASKKEYYKCASEAYSQIYTLLRGGKIAEPMKYISNAVIAVMIALLANFAIFKIATKNKTASEIDQIKECERILEHDTPEVKQTGEHRVYSPVSSSSGGGGRRRRILWRRWRRPAAGGGGGGHSF